MIIFPAIDLKDGQCVRLKKGVMDDATVFNADPGAQAKIFQAQKFEWLHCVDLNGAFAGKSSNAEAIKTIRAAITLPIQLGGGIRDLAAVEFWLAAGITRVILGTAALTDPAFVKEAASWAEVSELTPVELGRRFEDVGVAAVLFTDIDGDGLLQGVNVPATAALARSLSIPVIASGGVGSIADIEKLKAAQEPNIAGVVVGRALYDGRIDPATALALAKS
jgi:phosphoribosylformimino-5-aminoimidazole carboxamide ribotide isomerase